MRAGAVQRRRQHEGASMFWNRAVRPGRPCWLPAMRRGSCDHARWHDNHSGHEPCNQNTARLTESTAHSSQLTAHALYHPPQLRLRGYEPERGPPTRADGPLEPASGARRVSPQQEPVADAVAEGGKSDVRRIGRRHDLVRTDAASIEAQSHVIEIAARRTGAVAVEYGLSLGGAAGPHQGHPRPVDRARALS